MYDQLIRANTSLLDSVGCSRGDQEVVTEKIKSFICLQENTITLNVTSFSLIIVMQAVAYLKKDSEGENKSAPAWLI